MRGIVTASLQPDEARAGQDRRVGEPTKAFEQTLRKDDRVRRFEILVDSGGWRAVEHAGTTVIRETRYSDWHRVERVRRAFTVETQALRAEGWRSEDVR
jgi:hypothetical protein